VSDYHESAVDRAIREAQERGAFDDLPGAGKPLDLGSPNDPDWWIKGLIHREQLDMTAALPSGIALRREVERLPDTLADVPTEAHARKIVEDLNRRILEDRRRPRSDPPVLARTVDVEDVLAAWRQSRSQRFARPAAADDRGTDLAQDESTEHTGRTGWWWRLFGGG
jgi:hypothetical protein